MFIEVERGSPRMMPRECRPRCFTSIPVRRADRRGYDVRRTYAEPPRDGRTLMVAERLDFVPDLAMDVCGGPGRLGRMLESLDDAAWSRVADSIAVNI